ncbi:proline iminopeptidase-family hydrolase [Sphingomonas sp. ID0503]|uniref:proline iminopeptidase-family hydrolase n=1 Tax=Sphingomonas sp. ID0503 TaxID=3399691 RepID=UPI003AFA7377
MDLTPDREEMVPVPGSRAYVRINGDLAGPRPPIVFIHGGPGSAHWYFLNALPLASERAVILYDQLDSGRSDTPNDPANWHVSRFVDELEAIRAHLGVTRWHVLGASWGGTVALEYGARRPPQLASLILQSPLISTDLWLKDASILKERMPPETRAMLDRCDGPNPPPAAGCEAATDAFYARHVRMRPPSPAIEAYRAALPRSFSPAIYNAMWGRAEFTATGSLKDYDGRPLLARLDGRRTLFVAGEHDEARPETVADFAREVPHASFAMIPDAAHSIMNDNGPAFVARLRRWFAEVEA